MKSLESRCSPRALRWIGLVVGCLNIIASGVTLASNAYINDMKELFNFTQSNIELIAATAQVGASVGPPVGLVLDRFGPTVSFISALILGVGSCLLIVSSTYSVDFYHNNVWLLAIYAFIFGYATLIMYLTDGPVNMANFQSRHRGKVVAITGACWFLGPAILSPIYTELFSKNIRGFFLMLGLVFLVTNIFAAIFVKDYSHFIEETPGEDVELVEESDRVELSKSQKCINFLGLDLCSNLDYHLVSWAFFLSTGTQLMFLINIAVYLESYGLSNYITPLLIIGPIVASSTKLLSGILSDFFIESIPRAGFVAVGTFFQLLMFVISVGNGGSAPLFVVTVIFMYIANALYFCLVPALVSEMFGMRYFSRNFGGLVFIMALVNLGLLAIFGRFYDEQAGAAMKCFGQKCFRSSLIISSFLSFFAFILICVIVWREKRWRIMNR